MRQLLILALSMMIFLTVSCSRGSSSNVSNRDVKDRESETAEDRKSIDKVYDNWYTAWEKKDYKLAAQDYSDDAVWTNAFGMKRVGRAKIEETLKEVFDMDFVMAGESKTTEKTVKFIKPDVAVITSLVERENQESPSGIKMDTRKTSHLRVLVKSNGKWQIVSHLISDARSREKPEEH